MKRMLFALLAVTGWERRAVAVVWKIGGAVLGDAAVGVALAAAVATVAAAAIAAVAADVRAVARVAIPNKATARRATLSEACSKAMPSRAANSPAAGSEAALGHGNNQYQYGPDQYADDSGPPTGAVTYPYYTTRGPRHFLARNPNSIGP